MSDVFAALKQRISANYFDPTHSLSATEIRELVAYASESPSSFNIQHWRFVAVTGKTDKQKLKEAAMNQPKVADAAVTFIILGDSHAHTNLPDIMRPMLDSHMMDKNHYDSMCKMAAMMYGTNPQAQRDECIRSGAMAAMSLMLAAQSKGWVSGPMIGFDPEAVKKSFKIADHLVPVMLLAVGKAAPGNWPRKPRLTVDQVLSFNDGSTF